MATYSGTIDLRVTGNAEQKAELIKKRISEIKSIANTLKPVPNLFDKRGNDAIVKAKEELRKLVEQYGKGTGSGNRFSNTIAGLNRQLGGFNRILSNVNIKSDEFTQALTASEKVSRRLARAEAERLKVQTQINTANTVGRATSVQETLDLGKVIPKSIAGLELYSRELQENFRNVEIGSQSYRELRDEILRVNALMRDPVMSAAAPSSPIGGRADIPGSPAALRAGRDRRAQRGRDILTGAGFPLLFGGGPLQALAGGIGGAVGGLGGSIAGSAIASQLEGFARAAAETGVALTSTAGALEFVREKSLFSSEQSRELAAQLEEQGDVAELATLLTDELVKKVGNSGVAALTDLGDTTKETTALWNQLTTQLQILISGPLNGFLKLVNNAIGGINEALKPTAKEDFTAIRDRILKGSNEAAKEQVLAIEAAVTSTRKLNTQQKRKGMSASFLTEEGAATGLEQLKAAGLLPKIPVTLEDKRTITPQTTDAERLAKRTQQQNTAAANRLALLEAELRIAKETSELSKIDLEFDLKRTRVQQQYAKLISKSLSDQEKERLEKAQKLDLELLSVQRNEKISNHMRDQFESAMLLNSELMELIPETAVLKDEFKSLADTMNNEIINGIEGMIDGTKTLGQVASSMLKKVANQMLQMAIMGKSGSGGLFGSLLSGIGGIFTGGLSGFGPSSLATSGTNFFDGGFSPIDFFANGGRPPVGRPSVVGERGPELFVPRSAGTIIPNHAMGGANVTVNVDASGSAVQGDGNDAAQLGRAIGLAVQQELVKQKRPGGLLAN